MNNCITWAINSSINCISNNTGQDVEGEGQTVSISFTALGALTTLGALYYLNSNRNFFSARATIIWNQVGLLADSGRNALSVAAAAWHLNSAGILTQEAFNALLVHSGTNAWNSASALRRLNEAGILTEENLNALLANEGANACEITRSIWLLSAADCLTQNTYNALFANDGKNSWEISNLLRRLNEAELLTEENLNTILNGDKERLLEIIYSLSEIDLLTQTLFDEVIREADGNSSFSCKCALD